MFTGIRIFNFPQTISFFFLGNAFAPLLPWELRQLTIPLFNKIEYSEIKIKGQIERSLKPQHGFRDNGIFMRTNKSLGMMRLLTGTWLEYKNSSTHNGWPKKKGTFQIQIWSNDQFVYYCVFSLNLPSYDFLILLCLLLEFKENFELWRPFLQIILYHEIMTSINFLCRQELSNTLLI